MHPAVGNPIFVTMLSKYSGASWQNEKGPNANGERNVLGRRRVRTILGGLLVATAAIERKFVDAQIKFYRFFVLGSGGTMEAANKGQSEIPHLPSDDLGD